MKPTPITVQVVVNAPIEKVWHYWNDPKHIPNWAFASDDWECPGAESDLCVGGKFRTVMSAKDKSASFDFEGVYTVVVPNETVEYDMPDGRHVVVAFSAGGDGVTVTESFDPENENPIEMQRAGWQSILENFKKYVESN